MGCPTHTSLESLFIVYNRAVLIMQLALLKNRIFAYAKTKTQISFAVTAKLISAFVFAIRIIQFLYYLNPKFQASLHFLWLYSLVFVGPGRKPRRPVFSERGSSNTRTGFEIHRKKTCIRGFRRGPTPNRSVKP